MAGSDVRKDIRLCGEQFGLGVLMHRYFELGGWTFPQPVHPRHRGYVRGYRHGIWRDGPYVAAYGVLSDRLKRLQPTLAARGVLIDSGRTKAGRYLEMTRTVAPPTHAQARAF
ncbi:hypothetical protein [Streptomyces sp. DT203]|uniref:hypothetical protein n=1 Tax=unclassified Streptomyces TaxID=2593676 RepID=UPI003CF4097C